MLTIVLQIKGMDLTGMSAGLKLPEKGGVHRGLAVFTSKNCSFMNSLHINYRKIREL